jgi:hypothetical protein
MGLRCAGISLEKIRARISFGTPGGPNSLTFETPDVKSFSVQKSRGTLAATFSASIDMPSSLVIPAGEDLIIEAGTEGNLQRIFTGSVLSMTVSPSFENASKYNVNLSGSDIFRRLEGKNISRRQRARGLSTFAAITGVSSQAPQKGISGEKRQQSGGSVSFVNKDTNVRELSKLVRTDRISFDPYESAKPPEKEDVQSASAASAGQTVVDIKPRTAYMGVGVSALFNIENTTYEDGDSWGVTDPQIGRIQDRQDGTAIYTQLALGENTITFTKGGGAGTVFVGKATANGIMIHDHSSLGQGGPAFGVFSSD